MSALSDALKTSQKKNKSSKGPAFYNNAKSLFIDEMSKSADEITRINVARSANVPVGVLKKMLISEQDLDVIKTIIMNPRTPWKTITKFFKEDSRANAFDADEEVVEYLTTRVKSE